MAREDLTGRKYNKWLVLYHIKGNNWMCQCIGCNKTIKPVDSGNLKNGSSTKCQSCGRPTKHGMSNTVEFRKWSVMKKRYPDHEWKNFVHFYSTVNVFALGCAIHPKDESKPIGPNNWTSKRKRYKGKQQYLGKCSSNWADELGISREGMRIRILRHGSLEKAVKIGKRQRPVTHGMTGTRLYHLWLRLKNDNLLCNEWQDFIKFYSDVSPTRENRFLRRKNTKLLFSPTNFVWSKIRTWEVRTKAFKYKKYEPKERPRTYTKHRFMLNGQIVGVKHIAQVMGLTQAQFYRKFYKGELNVNAITNGRT